MKEHNELTFELNMVENIEVVGILEYVPGGMFHPSIEIKSTDGTYNLMALFKQHAIDGKIVILSAEIMEVSKK